jgi:hypothetical protein
MSLSVDEYVYHLATSTPDRLGFRWITIQRRVVEAIEDGHVTLSRSVYLEYPEHTPPGSLEAIRWELGADAGLVVPQSMIGAGKAWEPAPALGDAEEIDTEAVTAALLAHRNHKFNNRERGSPLPSLTLEQERLFAIAEYREGLKAW